MPEQTGPTVADVVGELETLYPLHRAEDWDRVGLVLGHQEAPVRRVLLAVDPTVAVAHEARHADLLVTHHPLLLRGATHLPESTGKGATVAALVRSGTALWCGHTNVDRSAHGTAAVLADALELVDRTALVPPSAAEDGFVGLGVWGRLPRSVTVAELAGQIARVIPPTVQGVKFTGDPERRVRRIAYCPGAGDSELDTATASGADVYITSDLRHHPALEHLESRADPRVVPALIDIPHYAAEQTWLQLARRALGARIRLRGWEIAVDESRISTDPWSGAVGGRSAETPRSAPPRPVMNGPRW